MKGYTIPIFPHLRQKKREKIKNQLFVKVSTTLLLALLLLVGVAAQAQQVSYSGKALPAKLFSDISAQTGYKFFYSNEALAGIGPISVQLKEVPLEKALGVMLEGLPLEFVIQGKTVFIRKKAEKKHTLAPDPAEVQQDVPRVHGLVTDEQGNALPGITIMTKRDHRAVPTNENGYFVYPAEKGDTLIFRSINYQILLLPAKFGEQMKVILKQQVSQLSAVSVYNTGYQQLSKERATGSFAKPDMDIVKRRVGARDVTDVIGRLDGQVAGLTVKSGLNNMGSRSNANGVVTRRSLIRGNSSVLLDGEPLYVINGLVSTDFSAVNPDDIEDITILKDAAAAAIYGARAANGVVVVTTRQGKKNQRMNIDYAGSVTVQSRPEWAHDPMLNSQQYIQVARQLFDPVRYPWASVSTGYVAPHDVILYNKYRGLISEEQANKSLDSLASIDGRSQMANLFYQPAITHSHTLSVSGGNNIYSYYLSLGYANMQGIHTGEQDNTYKLNLTQQFNPGKRVSITLNTSLNDAVYTSDGIMSIGSDVLPYQQLRDANGRSINMPYMTGYGDSLRQDYQTRSRINLDYYPLDELNYQHNKRTNLTMNVNGRVGVQLWKGLRFEGVYGYQKTPGTYDIYSDNKSLNMRKTMLSLTVAPTAASTPVYYLPLTGGYYNAINNDQHNWMVRNQLVYTAQPRGGKDALTLQAGLEAQEQYSYNTGLSIYGYNRSLGTYPVLDYLTMSKGIQGTITGTGYLNGSIFQIAKTVSRFNSYFALGSYSFNQKYSLDMSWRQDQSSLFGSDVSSQNKPVWSIGGKWRMDKEPFLSGVKWVDALALRSTYGILGNSPYVGAATLYDVLYPNAQVQSGGIAGDGLDVNRPANRKLSWESVKTVNVGIDFALFNNRINGSIEGYHKTTVDLLSYLPANPFTGFSQITGNLGKAVNKGIEITLGSENIRTKNFRWTTRWVFSYNKNELVSWGVKSQQTKAVYTRIGASYVAGYTISPLFAYRYAGLDSLGDPQIKLANGKVTKNPYIATADDVVYMGVTQPKFNGGLTNTFSYKGFSLSANLIYNLGHVMRRNVSFKSSGRLSDRAYFGGNLRTNFLDRWQKPGDEAFTNVPSYVPSVAVDYTRRNMDYYNYADINVVSASYIKLRDISLTYDLQPDLLKHLNLQRASVFIQASNFMVWKANHYGIDPEYNADPSVGTYFYPTSKHSYGLGLRVTL
ncbi:SusC/RagA family TonB-linked outer membrane protein [Chitinophaga eiseniae]|uniref:SusC/RagA family TonB-linked outer membrane protein n=1 Tax=Chitinophaga eiseniae TaxID=634771 RepID=A0A847SLE1_9BACT|nr:SusC/RagA family TonB-linked outer membrane protein [Chitinophaga eiseniae]NLR78418.1 SusC/RagA family TonB-linked outer membrane protein [Chitinophaga eiseniae]